MVSIAGGEPLLHPDIDRDGRRARRAQELRLPVHERACCCGASSTASRRRRTSRSSSTSTGCASATTRPSTATACSTAASTPSGRRAARGFRVTTNSHVLQHRLAQDRARGARLPERRPRRRRHDDLARLRLREGARPGALPRRRARRRSCSGRPSPTAGAASGGSTTRRCSSTSSRARSTSRARRGAIPSYSVFGWQRPCYLMSDGYAETLPASSSRRPTGTATAAGKDPRCDNCMAHCGYEPSAVVATTQSLRQSLRAALNR